jgi:hypothetical protein
VKNWEKIKYKRNYLCNSSVRRKLPISRWRGDSRDRRPGHEHEEDLRGQVVGHLGHSLLSTATLCNPKCTFTHTRRSPTYFTRECPTYSLHTVLSDIRCQILHTQRFTVLLQFNRKAPFHTAEMSDIFTRDYPTCRVCPFMCSEAIVETIADGTGRTSATASCRGLPWTG